MRFEATTTPDDAPYRVAPIPEVAKVPEVIAGPVTGAPLVAVPQSTTAVTAQSIQPIIVALARGCALALVIALIALLRSVQLGNSWADAAISAALLFLVTIQTRGIIEGAFDQWRATKV